MQRALRWLAPALLISVLVFWIWSHWYAVGWVTSPANTGFQVLVTAELGCVRVAWERTPFNLEGFFYAASPGLIIFRLNHPGTSWTFWTFNIGLACRVIGEPLQVLRPEVL